MMSEIPTIIVPARLESSRIKRKLLLEIKGKPLIIWTADRIMDQVPEFPLFFAVDSKDLYDCLKSYGYVPIMTSCNHVSGTDRIAEANKKLNAKYIINVQGDEPLIFGSQIKALALSLQAGHPMTTLAGIFKKTDDFCNPNNVKVVIDHNGEALYFSRAPIPYVRTLNGALDEKWIEKNKCFKHIGIYGYEKSFLEKIVNMKKSKLESFECLEQLRVLENGHKIHVSISEEYSLGIDTEDDIKKFTSLVDKPIYS